MALTIEALQQEIAVLADLQKQRTQVLADLDAVRAQHAPAERAVEQLSERARDLLVQLGMPANADVQGACRRVEEEALQMQEKVSALESVPHDAPASWMDDLRLLEAVCAGRAGELARAASEAVVTDAERLLKILQSQ
jgi:hypothetical protein